MRRQKIREERALAVWVGPEVFRRLDNRRMIEAERTGRIPSRSDLLREAINRYLNETVEERKDA